MKISKLLSAIAGFLFFTALLLTVIDFCCFRRSFYEYEYDKGTQEADTGMNREDLMAATDTLLDYLQDKRDDIVVEATVNGVQREVYNERETLHMVDVKNLYQNAVKARNYMVIGTLILLAGAIALSKDVMSVLRDACHKGLLLLAGVVIFCLAYALIDFNDFWIRFHYVFFDNDLFFLDPNTSLMINMMTEQLFFDLVMRIIVLFTIISALILVMLHFVKGKSHAERGIV